MQDDMDIRWLDLGSAAALVNLEGLAFREYQFNIISEIFKGQNTLVVLPTGLGKTLISVFSIANQLSKGQRCIMLSPTKPLSEQHFSSMESLLKVDKEKLLLLTGALGTDKRKLAIANASLIVATPQTVANEIKKGILDISDFSMVVFDECHRAVGKYAYTFVADAALNSGTRIVGLTASPGSNPARIKKILNVLGIEQIQARSMTDPDVSRYVMPKSFHVQYVDKTPAILQITTQMKPLIEGSMEKLRSMGLMFFKHFETMPKGRLIELGTSINKISSSSYRFGALFHYVRLLNFIHAYDLIEIEGLSPYVEFMESLANREKKSKAVESILNESVIKNSLSIAREAINNGSEHAKVNALVELINRNKEKSTIVFAQYRSTVKMLTRMLIANGIDAMAFLGKKEGYSQETQKQVISEFKEKGFKVLVSSSIGEEGLEIPSVDQVVFYESVPSEIRNIQRKGRTGRHYSGEVFVLVAKGTKDEIYLHVAANKEKKMMEQITKAAKDLQSKIGKKQHAPTASGQSKL